MSKARCVLRIGGKARRQFMAILSLDYFAAADGQHENGGANDTKRTRVD